MRHSAEDFATLSSAHRAAARNSLSPDQHGMHLAIADHYERIAVLKGSYRGHQGGVRSR